nr:MAG TPA: hypothetical protein [Caudoviricetes sp.]
MFKTPLIRMSDVTTSPLLRILETSPNDVSNEALASLDCIAYLSRNS